MASESEIELKPCPFCGGEAIKFSDRSLSLETGAWCIRSFVACNDCTALVNGKTIEDAAEAWNRRAE